MRGFFDRLRGGLTPSTPTGFNPGPLMEVAMTCFNQNGWKYHPMGQGNALQFGFTGKSANFEGALFVEEDAEEIIVLFRAPNRVPEDRRLAVPEFLTRANYGMKFGALEMDFNTGEVRFKMSAVLREGQLSPQMVHAMVGSSLGTLDGHYPALMRVCFGDQLPSEALKAVRSRPGGAN